MRRFSIGATFTLVVLSVFCAAVVTRAQNREKFVISAKAGGVNSVIGRVTVRHKLASQPELVTAQQDLDAGDVVDTGTSGRIEVLLNPGSYFRAAERSRFALTDNSLERLTLTLLSGSAIIEATGTDGVNMQIDIDTPQAHVAIVKRGIYRLNVSPGQTELLVLKGKAIVNGDSTNPVRGDHKAVLNGRSVVLAKLDKERDEFDSWSKDRAETLAQANRHIPARALSTFLSSYPSDGWFGSSFFGRSGIWVYNRMSLCYTFLPFYGGWGSPYGGGYSSFYWGCNYCGGYQRRGEPVIVNNSPGNSGGPGGSGGAGGSGGPGGSGGSIPGSSPAPTEPASRPISRDVDAPGPRGKNIEPPE
ncbi:MAG: FecR family protein [Pyrinomonadaceae bacterium]